MHELPRRYTPDELEAIAKAAGVEKCGPVALEKLQRAAEAYQWGTTADEAMGKEKGKAILASSTNKGRRQQLEHIIKLCKQIEIALNELDGPTSHLLGPVDNTERLQFAAVAALKKIPSRGPNPRRARRQFISELACIFCRLTGKAPGRSVHDGEGGLFFEFVQAALEPFKATTGCEADIKAVLHQRKKISSGRKPSTPAGLSRA
jgi:hypothetical protein